jgi:hypothetical protein
VYTAETDGFVVAYRWDTSTDQILQGSMRIEDATKPTTILDFGKTVSITTPLRAGDKWKIVFNPTGGPVQTLPLKKQWSKLVREFTGFP